MASTVKEKGAIRQVRLSTNGCCLLCLKVIPTPYSGEDGESNKSVPISVLLRHLKVKLEDVLDCGSKSDIVVSLCEATSLVSVPQLSVELCDKCANIHMKVVDIFEKLESLSMELEYHLEGFRWRILGAGTNSSRIKEYTRKVNSGMYSMFSRDIACRLRELISEQSSIFSSKKQPKVVVRKLNLDYESESSRSNSNDSCEEASPGDPNLIAYTPRHFPDIEENTESLLDEDFTQWTFSDCESESDIGKENSEETFRESANPVPITSIEVEYDSNDEVIELSVPNEEITSQELPPEPDADISSSSDCEAAEVVLMTQEASEASFVNSQEILQKSEKNSRDLEDPNDNYFLRAALSNFSSCCQNGIDDTCTPTPVESEPCHESQRDVYEWNSEDDDDGILLRHQLLQPEVILTETESSLPSQTPTEESEGKKKRIRRKPSVFYSCTPEPEIEIDTKELATKIIANLRKYLIPQSTFARVVLGRTQGTVSDLLRNPKPWSRLNAGRRTFQRMWEWYQEPELERMTALKLAAAAHPTTNGAKLTLKKKPRLIFTGEQRRLLEEAFNMSHSPSKETQRRLASDLGLQLCSVTNFFTNARRRSKEKWNMVNKLSSTANNHQDIVTEIAVLSKRICSSWKLQEESFSHSVQTNP